MDKMSEVEVAAANLDRSNRLHDGPWTYISVLLRLPTAMLRLVGKIGPVGYLAAS
jgi:hypothetical protein